MKKTRITTALGVTGLTIATLAVGLPAAANAATPAPSAKFTALDGIQVTHDSDGAHGALQRDLTTFQVLGDDQTNIVQIRDTNGKLLCTASLRGVARVGSCTTSTRLPDGDTTITATPLGIGGAPVGAPATLHAIDERAPETPTDPGAGDEDAATPAPTIQNVVLKDGTLTADVTTTGEGLVYVFNAAGQQVGFSTAFAGHANGTTAQTSVDKVKPGEQLSVSLLGKAGESTHTPFTAPGGGTGPVDPPAYSGAAELVSYDATTKTAVIKGSQNDAGTYAVSYTRDGVRSPRIAHGDVWPDEPFTATLPSIEPGDRINVVLTHSGQITSVYLDIPRS